jgi:hypothetical protein
MNFAAALNDETKQEIITTPVYSLEVVKPDFQKYIVKVEEMANDAMAIEITDQDKLQFAVALGGSAKKIAKAIEAKKKEVTQEASDFVQAVGGFCDLFLDKLVANTKKSNTESIELLLKKKIGDYQYQVELERRKKEEAARKATEELQARLKAEADEANRKSREEAARKAEEETKTRLAKEAAERKEKESRKEAEDRVARELAEIAEARSNAEAEAAKHEVVAPTVLVPVFEKADSVTRSESGASAHMRKSWTFEIVDVALVPRECLKVDEQKIRDQIRMGIRELPGIRIFEISQTVIRS